MIVKCLFEMIFKLSDRNYNVKIIVVMELMKYGVHISCLATTLVKFGHAN